jgi:hypothetical protein
MGWFENIEVGGIVTCDPILIPDAIQNATAGDPSICAGFEAGPEYLKRLQSTFIGNTNLVKVSQTVPTLKNKLLHGDDVPARTLFDCAEGTGDYLEMLLERNEYPSLSLAAIALGNVMHDASMLVISLGHSQQGDFLINGGVTGFKK